MEQVKGHFLHDRKWQMGRTAYLDDVAHFLFVQTAVSVSVINLERPSEFVLQFSSENQMNRCHVLQEVYFTILEGTGTAEPR